MECSGFADDNEVFYVASVDMCTLPAIVTLKVSQPYTGFLFAATSYSDIKHQIGNYFISNIHIEQGALSKWKMHFSNGN